MERAEGNAILIRPTYDWGNRNAGKASGKRTSRGMEIAHYMTSVLSRTSFRKRTKCSYTLGIMHSVYRVPFSYHTTHLIQHTLRLISLSIYIFKTRRAYTEKRNASGKSRYVCIYRSHGVCTLPVFEERGLEMRPRTVLSCAPCVSSVDRSPEHDRH